ncbi:TPA: hypothetical protein QEM98_000426 [Stenotrophomonas maltophilia]|nr:hypothetical protein [Stenotrophomonas maltophilia]
MSIIADNAERILELVRGNGGTMTGEQLRVELADISATDRRNAVARLRSEGRLTSTGATTLIRYHFPGRKQGKAEAEAEPPVAATSVSVTPATQPVDQFEMAERMANERMANAQQPFDAALVGVDNFGRDVSRTVHLSVPLLDGVSPELQLMAALDQIIENLASTYHGRALKPAELARATAWLASKHQVLPA